jgi:hypothetical protein
MNTISLKKEKQQSTKKQESKYLFHIPILVDSIRDAVLTVSPNRHYKTKQINNILNENFYLTYRGILRPTTPATHAPECNPIRTCNGTPGI